MSKEDTIELTELVPPGSLGRWVSDKELERLRNNNHVPVSHGLARVRRTAKNDNAHGEVITPTPYGWKKLGIFGEHKKGGNKNSILTGVYDITYNHEVEEYAEQDPERLAVPDDFAP